MDSLNLFSDRDKIFTSDVCKELFKLWGTTLLMSTRYHPQTDGQSERVNQCLEMYLRCAVHSSPKQWRGSLPMAEFWYNSTHHSSLGCSPFKALYGYGPVLLAVPDPCPPATTIVQDWVTEKEAHNTMQQMLATAQNRMEIQADKKRN
jgi:hypothetical protein